MSSVSRTREREELERELETEAGRAMLEVLKKREGAVRGIASWRDLAAIVDGDSNAGSEKDRVLSAVLVARREVGGPLWDCAILFLLIPGLVGLCRKKCGWDRELDDIWQELVAGLLEAIGSEAAQRWKDQHVLRLLSAAGDRAYERYGRRWRAWENEDLMPLEEIDARLPGVDHPGFAACDNADDRAALEAIYRRAFEARVIHEEDYSLLVETEVLGRGLAEVVREEGGDYQRLKKRRQRAVAAVRRWMEGP